MRVTPRRVLEIGVLLLIFSGAELPTALRAQVETEPILRGEVLVGDSLLRDGRVVLHRIAELEQGELDSIPLGPDGTFSFLLPSVPDPSQDEMYFASIRHQGVLYFGTAVTTAVQLDSVYRIQAYDTLVVSGTTGADLPVPIRNVFLEPEDDHWRATDLIQVRNDRARTLVSLGQDVVWRYPLPEAATLPTMGGDVIPGSTEFVDGELRVYSALPPGERVFMVRYRVPDPFVTLTLPGETEVLEVLVREPAPPISAPTLEAGLQVELEPGSTYRRFSGSDLSDARVQLVAGEEEERLPMRWIAVGLALLLASVALWAVLGRPEPAPSVVDASPAGARRTLMLEIARLDQHFEAHGSPTPEERNRYRNRRRLLLDRLADVD